MKITKLYRTEVTQDLTVSTVQTARGAFETVMIITGGAEPRGGRCTDGRRTTSKSAAGLEHDQAVAVARGRVDAGSVRGAFWTAQIAAVAS